MASEIQKQGARPARPSHARDPYYRIARRSCVEGTDRDTSDARAALDSDARPRAQLDAKSCGDRAPRLNRPSQVEIELAVRPAEAILCLSSIKRPP